MTNARRLGSSRWQRLVNEAHETWHKMRAPKVEDLAAELDGPHRAAFVLAKLNYQVQNGGFGQWHANGYSMLMVETLRALRMVDTETSAEALKLVQRAQRILSAVERERDEDERDCLWEKLNTLDDPYYKLNDQLESDIIAYFEKGGV